MRIAISSAEPSGDVLATALEQELRREDAACTVARLAAPRLLGPVLGIEQSLRSATKVRRVLKAALAELTEVRPDLAVLVSFAGLHLPLGRRCRRLGIPVLFLSPPQVWAWGGWRLSRLQAAADRIVCLFDFEQRWLRRHGVEADWFGNPFVDIAVSRASREETLEHLGFDRQDRYIALLPGSRPEEIRVHGPLLARALAMLRDADPGLRGAEVTVPGPRDGAGETIRYDIIAHAECALAVSGTVTVEIALLGTPMVVCYRLPPLSMLAARVFVRTSWFALPNIISGRAAVPELLNPSPRTLAAAGQPLLSNAAAREAARRSLAEVRQRLGAPGAMRRIAALIVRLTASRGMVA